MKSPCFYDSFWDMADILAAQLNLEQPAAPSLRNIKGQPYSERTFIDLFAGADCLSLGLMSSGWQGSLAVEKNAMAFETLSHNLIEGTQGSTFQWPEWFPKKPWTVGRVVGRYRQQLLQLRGKVTMIVGGLPCQGFSLAGRRNKGDARNSLFKAYIRIVEVVQPLFILLENVHGIMVEFDKKARSRKKVGRPPVPYSRCIPNALYKEGYEVNAGLLRTADYGVPQLRPRYFLFAAKRGVSPSLEKNDPFNVITDLRENFLVSKGPPIDRPISVKEAILDLATAHGKIPPVDSANFMHGTYAPSITQYQHLMRGNLGGTFLDSHRLANHRLETVSRFKDILTTCRRGVHLSVSDRKRFGLKKHSTVPLDQYLLYKMVKSTPSGGQNECRTPAIINVVVHQPSPTLTTLPDDIIHYSDPRILTVREYAHPQSIPDWFQFRGPYTTSGHRRVHEGPRYTQAGNAVPPFIREVIGDYFTGLHSQYLATSTMTQLFHSDRSQLEPVALGGI